MSNDIVPSKIFSSSIAQSRSRPLLRLCAIGFLIACGHSVRGQSDAWTGVITYTRTQSQTDTKTVERVSERGKDTRDWEMKYDYKATVGVIESPEKNGQSVGTASITHNFSSKITTVSVEKNSCDRGKTWQDMTGTFVTETKISGQAKEEANVSIGVNSDGTYTVSVGLPQISGILTGSESATYSGQCTPKKAKNLTMGPTATTIQGNSLSTDGSHRINPDDPNRLSGSYSLPLSGGVLETITWNLQKNAVPLRIIELKFEDMKYPKWDDWQEISEQVGTVDGNWVKLTATVFNGASTAKTAEVVFKETYQGDRWDGAKQDQPLKDQSFTLTFEPGEERKVEMLWDSSGYAWYDDGRPRQVQRIKAEIWENYKKADEKTKNLTVKPKPLIFVPGIWTKLADFDMYQNLLTTTHSYGWKTYAVIDTAASGTIAVEGSIRPTTKNRSVYEHADNLATYIDRVRGTANAWHVDLLAHCTGGLAARLYIHKHMEVLPDAYPVVKHLLMLGTPNNGVPCADSMGHNDAFKDLLQTAKELMPEEIALFNTYVTQRKGTQFSVLVGNSLPILCASPQWNDGFVSVESAKYGIEDAQLTDALHPDMVNTKTFNEFVKPRLITGPRSTYPLSTGSPK